jgi:hypothetical protein
MKINQNWVYVNLRTINGGLVMNISQMTEAARDMGLSCGDVLSGERVAVSPIAVEYCQLKWEELRAYLTNHSLTREEFCARFNVSLERFEVWENQ